jgi:hypothetical protein
MLGGGGDDEGETKDDLKTLQVLQPSRARAAATFVVGVRCRCPAT